MNFDFSDDQRLLQQAVSEMLADLSTSAAVREVLEGRALYSAPVWSKLIEMGAATAALPEAYGGAGLGHLELCLVAEEAGRQLAAVPLASSFYLAAELILRAGNAAQRQQWLPEIASGRLVATAALDSAERYRAPAALRLENGRLHGRCALLVDGLLADLAVLQVGSELVLVDLRQPGVEREALPALDPSRPLAAVSFDGVAAELLAEDDTSAVIERVRNGAAVLLAFEQIGGAARILEDTRSYSLERKAFGRQIGSFQAIKHKMAEIYAAIELARVHAYYGAWALSSDAPELARAAAAARVSATRAYVFAAEEGIELHGGIGFTWEMDCHLHYRRARHLGQILGSEHLWRARLADSLIKEAA